MEIIYAYTNIGFTEKQKEDITKTYDLLFSNDIIDKIINTIPEEVEILEEWLEESIASIYDYNTSVMGILDNVQTKYDSLDLDMNKLGNALRDPESLTLLKDIMPMVGLA
jgi:hypothetical protein